MASIDGHTVSGEIPFSWAPDDLTETSEGTATAPVCGAATEEPAPVPDGTEDEPIAPAPPAAEEDLPTDLLWIGGAIVAVVVAAGATMLALGRKKN